MNKKGFSPVIILLIIGVIALVGAAYYAGTKTNTQTPSTPSQTMIPTPQAVTDETSTWKIYHDSSNKIAFRYPNTWFAEPSTGTSLSQSPVFLDDHSFQVPTNTEFSTPIQVYLNLYTDTTTNQTKYSETTIEEGATRLKTYVYGETVKEVTNLSIGGRRAIQLSGLAGPGMLEGQSFKHTLIQLDGRVLIVSLSNHSSFEGIYNQILSTFKFD